MENLRTYLIFSTGVDDLCLLDWPSAQELILNLFISSMCSDILILFIRTKTYYPAISLIQVGYISKNFELNFEATRKFEHFWFNESWIRISGAFVIKCQGDTLYTSGLQSLYKGSNLIIITKEDMQEAVYDDDFLKFLF